MIVFYKEQKKVLFANLSVCEAKNALLLKKKKEKNSCTISKNTLKDIKIKGRLVLRMSMLYY